MQNSVPLRERKRRETWLALHGAAADLVRERGLNHATVDEIAERAGVSPRTFFNYFATKEEAVLGLRAPVLSEQTLHEFRTGGPGLVLERVVRLLLAVLRSTMHESVSLDERRDLVRAHPELRERVAAHTAEAETVVSGLLTELSTADDSTGLAELGLPESPDTARALLMLAGTVLRFVYARDPATVLGNKDTPHGAATDAALDEATAIFRKVIQATL